jgi:spermidine synthase
MSAHGAPKKSRGGYGGDGMAVREVLAHPGVESVVWSSWTC